MCENQVRSQSHDYTNAAIFTSGFAAWIADECHMHPQAVTRATDLYTAYREWCKRTGHRAFTQNKFGRELESRGFRKKKPTHGEYRRAVVRHGIELSPIGTN